MSLIWKLKLPKERTLKMELCPKLGGFQREVLPSWINVEDFLKTTKGCLDQLNR